MKLTAWGQDAHYIVADKVFSGSLKYKIVAGENKNITWVNDKPYLIYGYAVIDSKGHLNIDPGCRLHFFNNSGMWVYKDGSLHVNGTLNEPVTFQGSRLEPAYSESPGQWDRILINEGSKDNVINYAIIKNGFIGIQAETDSADMGNRLLLNNTIVRNMIGPGFAEPLLSHYCGNSVFANCGAYAVSLTTGGTLRFQALHHRQLLELYGPTNSFAGGDQLLPRSGQQCTVCRRPRFGLFRQLYYLRAE